MAWHGELRLRVLHATTVIRTDSADTGPLMTMEGWMVGWRMAGWTVGRLAALVESNERGSPPCHNTRLILPYGVRSLITQGEESGQARRMVQPTGAKQRYHLGAANITHNNPKNHHGP